MISVNMLSNYLYCPRKLYLQYVLKLARPPKEVLIRGRIRHRVFDTINELDKEIIKGIKSFTPYEDLVMVFRKEYSSAVREVLDQMKLELLEVGIESTTIFHKVWTIFLKEAQFKAQYVYDFMIHEKVYGDSLWQRLTPKILTEVSIESKELGLKGIIDRIEIHGENYIPVEIKTGKMPSEGVWPGDRIQLEAYMTLLVEEMNKNIKEGYIDYTDYNEKRRISMNPFVRDNILTTVQKVNEVLEGKLPSIVSNRNKCVSCSFRSKCHNLDSV
jgi:CRISPR-associated exonuclease Cas4